MIYADDVAGENKFLPVINFNTAADVATVALQRKLSVQSISDLRSITFKLCSGGGGMAFWTDRAGTRQTSRTIFSALRRKLLMERSTLKLSSLYH